MAIVRSSIPAASQSASASVLRALGASSGVGIDTRVDVLGSEGVGRDHGHERRVDAARQAEHHVGEAVLRDVVARGEHERVVHLGDRIQQGARSTAGRAGPGWSATSRRYRDDRERRGGVAAAGVEQARAEHRSDVEVDDLLALLHLDHAVEDLAVVVHHEGAAVEDQLVLAADLVDVHDVAVGVLGPGGDHPLPLAVAAAGSRATRWG